MSNQVVPFSLQGRPALIEKLLPVQKLSAEVFKERKAGPGQTLTKLGAYWKGRKPLILAKACILGCLLPATEDPARDLEIFEKLMAMDRESFVVRWPRRIKPKVLLEQLAIPNIEDYFEVKPAGLLPASAPVDWSNSAYAKVAVEWRADIPLAKRRRLEAQLLPQKSYRSLVESVERPEEHGELVHAHIWDEVNAHLNTDARSFPELVEQLGIMRYGRKPRMADTFCGSGQIPFEAARLGCDVYASDLNPVACMLTWGALHIVGDADNNRADLDKHLKQIVAQVSDEINALGVESDGNGWQAKAYLYCLEVRCPQTGWLVPLLPTRIISFGKHAVVDLVPDPAQKRYHLMVRSGVQAAEMAAAATGTVRSDGRGQEPYMVHTVGGVEYRTKIATLRGDYRSEDGATANRLRPWNKDEFKPRPDDLFQERLYAVHWMKRKPKSKKYYYEFRSVTDTDLERERKVEEYVAQNLIEWQARGWIPDMRIEPGEKTDEPIRTRGWTYWHHLFPARHLMLLGLLRRETSDDPATFLMFSRIIDYTSKLCRWTTSSAGSGDEGKRSGGASDNPANVFYNQALNTFYNYGIRASLPLFQLFEADLPIVKTAGLSQVGSHPASDLNHCSDLFITDPPYGDAVKYEEILEFFIAWLRKNPPPAFAGWVWDSRRALAIKGEDEAFRRAMVAAYRRMAECMSDDGRQVVMFTHQSGTIWADMANIVWAAGLQVTAAWYVVTETDSALREGSYVKGTVLLVLRKRKGSQKTTRDELAWEIQEEVEQQVAALTGLNQAAKGLYRDENVFEDVDLQMAGYAAALRVLTQYAVIDGRDMSAEAARPRLRGETTFIDDLIAFAVDTANRSLVPSGIDPDAWARLSGAERFYLKMVDLEAHGARTLDNYQNFAKAFKVRDYRALMGSQRANAARLKSAVEFERGEMGEGSELHDSVLRAVLYALWELVKEVDSDLVLNHLTLNVPNYYGDLTQRLLAVELADYLAGRLAALRPEEAGAARVLSEAIKNKRLG